MTARVPNAGWSRVKFGDVVNLNRERIADPLAAGVERYIGIEHIEPEDLRVRSWGLVEEGTTFTNAFRPGQVLFVKRRAYQRKVAVADFSGVCSSDIYVLESADPEVLLPDLLPFLCQTEALFEHAVGTSAGSLSPRTNWERLAAYEFALPPLAEQRRIAEVLWAVEDELAALQQLATQAELLRKSMLIDIFSRLEKDKSVKWVRVEQAGEALMGRQRSPKYDKGISPRPYLRVANVYDGYIDTSDVKEMDFSDEEFERYRLLEGDVLLVEGHSSADVVGRSTIFRNEVRECCMQNTLLRFRSKKVSPEFAHQYFRYCLYSGRFSAVAKQTTIAHLGSTRFTKMSFPLVGRSSESEIVERLENVEQGIAAATKRLEQIQQMKRVAFYSELSG